MRGKKTRNGGRWTEAQFMGQIRQAMRKLSMYWRTGDDYLKSIRVDLKDLQELRGEFGRCKYAYPCEGANCGKLMRREDVELDHRVPCGKLTKLEDLSGFAMRLFVEADGWQALCAECHRAKTNSERL